MHLRARQQLRDQYGGLIRQYSEASSAENGGLLEQLRNARRVQGDYLDAVQSYQSVYRSYQAAKYARLVALHRQGQSNGSVDNARAAEQADRARTLARRLDTLAERVNASSKELIHYQRNISEQSGVNITAASVVRDTRMRIAAQQASIRDREFERTRLSLHTSRQQASFVNPVSVSGRLETVNGSPVRNRSVRLLVGNRQLNTTTDGEGQFEFMYRPAAIPLNASTVTFRYTPRNTSRFLGSKASIPISVEQVQPRIEVTVQSEPVGYNDTFGVKGHISADGIGADGIALTVLADDQDIGSVNTSADGSFHKDVPLPAEIADGNRTLRVAFLPEERALAPTRGTASLMVVKTPTRLDVVSTRIGPRSVRVTGTLRTQDNELVRNRTIGVMVNETTVATTTANASGQFAMAVAIPPSTAAPDGGPIKVEARFEGDGTNLAPTRSASTIDIAAVQTGYTLSFDGIPFWMWGGTAGLLIVVLGWMYRRELGSRSSVRGGSREVEGHTDTIKTPNDAEPTVDELLSVAQDELHRGQLDSAVTASYQSARRRLASSLDLPSTGTHWDFFNACEDADIDATRLESFRGLTEQFERAAFASSTVSADSARRAVNLATTLIGEADGISTGAD